MRRPKAANTIWQRAIAKWKLNEYTPALNDFKLYLKIKPQDEEAYFWMGQICESMGNNSLAIDYYNQALLIDNTYEDAQLRVHALSPEN